MDEKLIELGLRLVYGSVSGHFICFVSRFDTINPIHKTAMK